MTACSLSSGSIVLDCSLDPPSRADCIYHVILFIEIVLAMRAGLAGQENLTCISSHDLIDPYRTTGSHFRLQEISRAGSGRAIICTPSSSDCPDLSH